MDGDLVDLGEIHALASTILHASNGSTNSASSFTTAQPELQQEDEFTRAIRQLEEPRRMQPTGGLQRHTIEKAFSHFDQVNRQVQGHHAGFTELVSHRSLPPTGAFDEETQQTPKDRLTMHYNKAWTRSVTRMLSDQNPHTHQRYLGPPNNTDVQQSLSTQERYQIVEPAAPVKLQHGNKYAHPAELQDWQALKFAAATMKMGTLGADKTSEQYQKSLSKAERQRQFAEKVRDMAKQKRQQQQANATAPAMKKMQNVFVLQK